MMQQRYKERSFFTDPTFLFALLCITIMAGKKLVSGEVELVTKGFFLNPWVIGTFLVGLVVYKWATAGKQVPLTTVDQWSANWYMTLTKLHQFPFHLNSFKQVLFLSHL